MSQFTFNPKLVQASFIYPSASSSRTNSPLTNGGISNSYHSAPSMPRARPKFTPTLTLGPNGWQPTPDASLYHELSDNQFNPGHRQIPHHKLQPQPLPPPLSDCAPVQQQGWISTASTFRPPSSAEMDPSASSVAYSGTNPGSEYAQYHSLSGSAPVQQQSWMPITSMYSMEEPRSLNGYQTQIPPEPVLPSTMMDPLAQQPLLVPAFADIQPPGPDSTTDPTDDGVGFHEAVLPNQLSTFPLDSSYSEGPTQPTLPNQLSSWPISGTEYAQQQPPLLPATADIQTFVYPDPYSVTDCSYDGLDEDALFDQFISFPSDI
ncbi:hypothetical protein HYPSUDRAFT_1102872 [Hypholoma sublateritium FD-334 SS-4]|uniref:Uncharacterized protein n=1 Tax=Hypholoma sublateritium (strain FD-334 SS-4) TaxID=945553 RepID=A0A0D2M3E3_HYPSF|nr:hypothetical protein HYPSUDRAFT_1102872 [Hypholoma sublateritium FD-334 SS-4]